MNLQNFMIFGTLISSVVSYRIV